MSILTLGFLPQAKLFILLTLIFSKKLHFTSWFLTPCKIVYTLDLHFVQRWNFVQLVEKGLIIDQKYNSFVSLEK